jgi:hypothetical protein
MPKVRDLGLTQKIKAPALPVPEKPPAKDKKATKKQS